MTRTNEPTKDQRTPAHVQLGTGTTTRLTRGHKPKQPSNVDSQWSRLLTMKKKNAVKLITISLISELNDSVRHLNWTKDKAELLACGVNECNLGNGYKV